MAGTYNGIAQVPALQFRCIDVRVADDLAVVASLVPLVVCLAHDVASVFAVARRARFLWPDALIIFLARALRLLALRGFLAISIARRIRRARPWMGDRGAYCRGVPP